MDRKTLSSRIRQARLEVGLKQKHLSECLGIPISAVSLLESGQRGLDVLELILVANLFSRQPEWFYSDEILPDRRRWSDKDSVIYDALNMFKEAPVFLQRAVASSMIAFFKSYKKK